LPEVRFPPVIAVAWARTVGVTRIPPLVIVLLFEPGVPEGSTVSAVVESLNCKLLLVESAVMGLLLEALVTVVLVPADQVSLV